ncbi:hypothetical protein ASE38_01550 [Cellulomonas sp. Root930]|nr:hypothetical protein ASE38_01550 [Cellulomonas sp. Root930]
MAIRDFEPTSSAVKNFELVVKLIRDSGIVDTFETAMARPVNTGGVEASNPYSVETVLVGYFLQIAGHDPITLPKMLQSLWQLSPEQIVELGMSHYVGPDRRAALTDTKAWGSEYCLFRHRFDQLMKVIDPSPHPRRTEPMAVRHARMANLTSAKRSELDEKEGRLQHVLDQLIEASTRGVRPTTYQGHVALDETLIPTFASKEGRGDKLGKIGPPDPDIIWYDVKKVSTAIKRILAQKKMKILDIYHRVVVGMPLSSPYSRQMPMVAGAVHVRVKRTETNTDAAVATVRAMQRNGWAPPPDVTPLVVNDKGYTNELEFPIRMFELGYDVIANAEQPVPKHREELDILDDDASKGARDVAVLPPSIHAGEVVCPAGRYLNDPRNPPPVWPPDERTKSSADVRAHQDRVDEVRTVAMPHNGRPKLVIQGPHMGKHALRVSCPALSRQCICALAPDSRLRSAGKPVLQFAPESPHRVCRTANSTVWLNASQIKHLDARTRGSVVHSAWYEICRAASERIFAFLKRCDMGDIREGRIEMLGVARNGFAVGVALAILNVRRVEKLLADYGSLDNLPYTDRDARRKAWNRIVDEERGRTA